MCKDMPVRGLHEIAALWLASAETSCLRGLQESGSIQQQEARIRPNDKYCLRHLGKGSETTWKGPSEQQRHKMQKA